METVRETLNSGCPYFEHGTVSNQTICWRMFNDREFAIQVNPASMRERNTLGKLDFCVFYIRGLPIFVISGKF